MLIGLWRSTRPDLCPQDSLKLRGLTMKKTLHQLHGILLSTPIYSCQPITCLKFPYFHDKNTYISLTIMFSWHAFHLFLVVLLFSRFSFHVSGFDLEFSRKTRILKNIVTKSLLNCCNMALLLKLTLAGFNIGV